MEQMSFLADARALWSVSQLSAYLRQVIEAQPSLQNVWVQGEISNFSQPRSGHWYFTLKDKTAQLPCVMWRSTAELQIRVPKDGESVEIHGGLSVYEAGGRYQLYVDEIRPAGEGALYQQFIRLKEKLEAEGLFAAERKRPIPARPQRIGIVTSPSGAALRDILHTLTRRYPLADVFVCPAIVQGDGADYQLQAAIKRINHYVEPDVILLARGGGSLEDLKAFNSEKLARAIVESHAPIISGVGHETDFTIADFAADLRAPTPTAAAELATPNKADLLLSLRARERQLGRAFGTILREQRWALQAAAQQLDRHSPISAVLRERQRLDNTSMRGERALRQQATLLRSELGGLQARLTALDPARVLERGYAVVLKSDGSVVRKAGAVAAGDELSVRVADGEFGVEVKEKN
jgi:exodeoxyribonuclease VII large subunit